MASIFTGTTSFLISYSGSGSAVYVLPTLSDNSKLYIYFVALNASSQAVMYSVGEVFKQANNFRMEHGNDLSPELLN
jgi:hypothetical protein